MIGRTLAQYEINALLGKGGMGEVFLAHDSKLHRDVALKFLPEEFARDPQRLQRFTKEARVLASLNHPNVAAIYSFEHVEEFRFLVMEYVQGESLADRIARGRIPWKEALQIARQVAQGLESAHAIGVVHRDLKPGNIQLTPESTVKVLDFGLARAHTTASSEEELQNEPTETAALTQVGAILGTGPYLSPECLKGLPADVCSDIWALGCVLYEMLTGSSTFSRPSSPETFAAILERDPDWDALPGNLPVEAERLLRRCLAKEPRERLHSVADVRIALVDILSMDASGAAPHSNSRRFSWKTAGVIGAVAFLLGAITLGYGLRPSSHRNPGPTLRFHLSPPKDHSLTPSKQGGSVAFSPGGKFLAFVAENKSFKQAIWLRDMESSELRELPGTEGARKPFWAPDGRSLGFFTGTELKALLVAGGKPRSLCSISYARGGTWNADGTIIFAPSFDSGLWRINAEGGKPTVLTKLDEARFDKSHRWPSFLPDGHHYLYLAWSQHTGKSAIFVGDLDSEERRLVVPAQSNAVYSSEGYLIYYAHTRLQAIPFDKESLQTEGQEVSIATDIDPTDYGESACVPVTLSRPGTLAYETMTGSQASGAPDLVSYDRQGEHGPVLAPGLRDPALSPDGRWVAGNRNDPEDGTWSLWLVDLQKNSESKFIFDSSNNFLPIWSPDGQQIVFASNRNTSRNDLYVKPADGRSSEKLLLSAEGSAIPMSWSPDGHWVLYEYHVEAQPRDLWVLPMPETDEPQPYIDSNADEYQGQFSPDGKWVAYVSNESGRPEIYTQAFPATGGKWLVSSAGGNQPRWGGTPGTLYYLSPDDHIMSVSIDAHEDVLRAGTPEALFQIPSGCCDQINTDEFVVSKDESHFLATVDLTRANSPSSRSITVVHNWSRLLDQ